MKRWYTLFTGLLLSTALMGQSPLEVRVDYTVENVELADALLALSSVAQVNISFSNSLLPEHHIISLAVKNQTVKAILTALLQDTPLEYRLTETGQQITLHKKTVAHTKPPSKTYTLSGYIEDSQTGERLISATLFVSALNIGAITNEYGFFSLSLPEGIHEYTISYIGYQTFTKEVEVNENQTLTFPLAPSVMLTEVVIYANNEKPLLEIETLVDHALPLEDLQSFPSLVGESDLNQVLPLLPGIQSGPDGVGGLHIRGGSKDQNLYLIDGVPVYNPSHALGFLSIFNPSVIKDVRLIKSNFPARYGGRLSSVLDVRTREGNLKKMEAEASIGLLAASLTLEGPLALDKTSFLISGRFSFLDTYLQPIAHLFKEKNGLSGKGGYRFYDLNAKLHHKFSTTDALYLSIYRGSDDFYDNSQFSRKLDITNSDGSILNTESYFNSARSIIWGNTIGALRWNHLFNNKLFSNTTLTFSEYRFDDRYYVNDSLVINGEMQTSSSLLVENLSSIRDVALRTDFDYTPTNKQYIRFGGGVTRHEFTPGILQYARGNETIGDGPLQALTNDTIQSAEWHAYIEDRITLSPTLVVNIGSRFSLMDVGQREYLDMQPRISAYWKTNSKWMLTASANKMTQFLHLLSSSNIGLTTDLWVPSTAAIRPEESWQVDAGLHYKLNANWNVSWSGYYKWMNHLLNYTEGGNTLTNWEDNITSGKGWAYGTEWLLQKQAGKTTGWLAYSLAWTERKFTDINNGRPYPFRFDRRHNVQVAFVYRLKENMELATDWLYGTGLAFSAPEGKYISEQSPFPVFIYDSKNKFRMPAYHRLDISLNIRFQKATSQQFLKIGAYNVYNKRNPLYYAFRNNPQPDNLYNKEFVQVKLLPIIPSVSYTVKL